MIQIHVLGPGHPLPATCMPVGQSLDHCTGIPAQYNEWNTHWHMPVIGLMRSHGASSWTPVTGVANWHVYWQRVTEPLRIT